jgi:hypothetical protein
MMNLMFSFKLASLLNKDQASMAFHPGLVKSELLNEGPKLLSAFLNLVSSSPNKSAAAIARLVTDENLNDLNGKFFNNNLKSLKAATHGYDSHIQEQLWDKSLKLSSM